MMTGVRYEGNCLCRKVSLVVEAPEEMMTFVCFCNNCTHVGGGAFAYMKAFADAQITITKGEDLVKEYQDSDNLSGNVALRYFCSNCGSPLYGLKTPGKTVVHGGMLEGKKAEPSIQSFGDKRPDWVPERPGH